MKALELVYVNNNNLGHFDKDVFIYYSKDEKTQILNDLEKQIIINDRNRKLSSLIIGLLMLTVAITLALLMAFNIITLGKSQWFNFTFILAGLVFVWILFYYIFGFFFYKKIVINYYFKSKKTTNPNSAVLYASSNYYKWVQMYSSYIKNTSFTIKEKKILIPFGLTSPSKFKNLIFNGKVASNIPYYYIAIKSQRVLFLPGMVLFIDGKNSKVLSIDEFKIERQNKTYLLYGKDKLLASFESIEDFNINFFYFKYEQC